MATAKKASSKSATTPKNAAKPVTPTKPASKAPANKIVASRTAQAIAKVGAVIAKLTGRKDKLVADLKTLPDLAIAPKTPGKAVAKAPLKTAAKVAASAKVSPSAKTVKSTAKKR